LREIDKSSKPCDVDELARQLGKRLKALRKDQGKSQETVAWWAGCSIPELSQYETGQRLPNTKRLVGLARALGVTLDALIPVNETVEQAKKLKVPARTVSEPGTDLPPAIVPGSFSESDQ
jgi:transcriptional regulator with XRE-family HTH domain